jgi:hypothetical protein
LNEQQPPKEICWTVEEWLKTMVEPYYSNSSLRKIYPTIAFKKNIRNPPERYPKSLEGGNVAIISNGRVWGKNGAIITPDNKLIWDVSLEYLINPWEHSIFKENQLPAISHYFDTVADLSHVGSTNYYHWMFEVLPRLHLIQASGINVNRYIANYEPEKYPYQNETLLRIGINPNQIIITDHHFHLKASNLIVPSQPYFFPTLWAYNYLRTMFLQDHALKDEEKKRIYISRKKNRRILNEEEIMKILIKYNFIKVELEKMSVEEQVKLFSSSEVIVGPHGAGLANLAFCSPGTKVFEIFPPTYITCLYWLVSSLGRLDYHYLIGDYGECEPELRNQQWHGNDNIILDIKIFEESLRKIGL